MDLKLFDLYYWLVIILLLYYNNWLKILNKKTGTCLYTLREHSDSIFNTLSNLNDKVLVSGSYDLTIKLWNLRIFIKSIKTIYSYIQIHSLIVI